MRSSRELRGKRAFDIIVGGSLLIASLPVQAVISALLVARLGRPILFKQVRPGLNEHPFLLLKFRTMLPENATRRQLGDEARMTPLGISLRSTSLDELPTLWNVVRGDMSLVGPRPLLTQYLDRYTPEQARRHGVRPGITGLAQVSGRNGIPWDERLELDVLYVDTMSWRVDLQILWKTVIAVTSRTGITERGHVTMSEFLGSSR